MRGPLIILLIVAWARAAAAQATAPTTGIVLPEGPLKATVTDLKGLVEVRPAPGQPWQKPTVGMELSEGAEFRVGPRSVVRFVIPPDQVVTIDRFTTVQLLKANFENGKFVTDLGMKYGRVRYDIEAAGQEYDARVRSPGSVLAVRGTRVMLYDQPPFAPQAVSFTGRARFTDPKKQVDFGNGSYSRVTTFTDSSAQTAIEQTNLDPRTEFAGRTLTESQLGLTLGGYSGPDYTTLTMSQRTLGTVTPPTGPALIPRSLEFDLFWNGTPFSDVELTVSNPLGQTLSLSNPSIPGVGSFNTANASAADAQGFGGFKQIFFGPSYLPGTYTIGLDLATAGPNDRVGASVLVIDPIGPDPPPIATINQALDGVNPQFQTTLTISGQPPTQPRRVQRKR
jgi:hypothetical protein